MTSRHLSNATLETNASRDVLKSILDSYNLDLDIQVEGRLGLSVSGCETCLCEVRDYLNDLEWTTILESGSEKL